MPKGLFSKNNVPPGSTLRVRLSPAAPPPAPDLWSAELFLRRSDGEREAPFDNAALRAGVTHPLAASAPGLYVGQVVVTFAGASSARVEIRLMKPDGVTPHGKPYDETHSSAPADAIALLILMA